jgi:hypothetical protein
MHLLARTRPRKRLFLGLVLASLAIASFSIYGLWRVAFPGLSQIHRYLPFALGALLCAFALALFFGVFEIVLGVLGVPLLQAAQGLAWWAVNLLLPPAKLLGKVFDIDRERIERSFIEVSNHLVRNRRVVVSPDRLLVLAPHCIQLDTCRHKVTGRVENCRGCGKCQVRDLLHLGRAWGVHVAVVPGGTLARKVIKDLRPRAVLAVACERDLVSGIQDVFPLPVVGVLNDRPNGPCCNTRVDVGEIERAVAAFVGKAGPAPAAHEP